MRPLNQVERKVLALLQAYKSSLNLKQIGEQLDGIADHDLKVALDTLVLRDLVERVDTGRQIIFVALAAPAAPASTPPVASIAAAAPAPAQAPPAPTTVPIDSRKVRGARSKHAEVRDRVLQLVAVRGEGGAKALELSHALMHDLEATKTKLKHLRDEGLLRLEGSSQSARWFITDAGRARLGITPPATPTESTPGLTPPAVQPIDTATSTAAPAAPPLSPWAEKEPAGPRDGLSSVEHAGDFEPAADELLAWHQQRAEHEAARRRPAFALPNAMRNTGDDGAADIAAVGCVLIDAASFALWSDGRLEIDAGSDHVTLSQPATRALLDYLDRVCAIEQH